jgi:hypothetical protein
MLFSCSFRYQNLLHNFETMNTSNLDDESNHENVCPDDLVRRVIQTIANEKETELINQADDSSETGDLDTDETKTTKKEKEIKDTVAREGGIDFITRKDVDHPLAKSEFIKSEVKTLVKSETIEMKTDLKTEIKQENCSRCPYKCGR